MQADHSMHRFKDYLPEGLSAVAEAYPYEMDLNEAMVSNCMELLFACHSFCANH